MLPSKRSDLHAIILWGEEKLVLGSLDPIQLGTKEAAPVIHITFLISLSGILAICYDSTLTG